MKTVCLLRHAKAAAEGETPEDHDRPLSPRGRRDAPEIGAWIQSHKTSPGLILCSTSARTRETVALAFPKATRPPVEYERGLYLATAETLLARVQALPDTLATVLLVGHNPGLGDLALALAQSPETTREEKLRRTLAAKLPTSGFVKLEFAIEHWRDLAAAKGRLAEFTGPKDL